MKKALFILGFLLPAAVASARDDIEAGRKAFDRCTRCHVTPDLSMAADQKWLASINGSA